MLIPHSERFFMIETDTDVVFVPKDRIELMEFNKAQGELTINLASLPAIKIPDTEDNVKAATCHRDHVAQYKRLSM